MIQVENISTNSIISENGKVAESFKSRLLGLMFENSFKDYDCLLLSPCRMIHTFGMKFNIDVIFISKSNVVVYAMKNLPPNRISPFIIEAHRTIELPENTIEKTNTKIGDILSVCAS